MWPKQLFDLSEEIVCALEDILDTGTGPSAEDMEGALDALFDRCRLHIIEGIQETGTDLEATETTEAADISEDDMEATQVISELEDDLTTARPFQRTVASLKAPFRPPRTRLHMSGEDGVDIPSSQRLKIS